MLKILLAESVKKISNNNIHTDSKDKNEEIKYIHTRSYSLVLDWL